MNTSCSNLSLKMPTFVDPSNNFKSFVHVTAAFTEKDKQDIISDCKTCFTCREVEDGENYSVGSTFFLKANDPPVCGLEALAMQIFAKHTEGKSFDPALSGAEWWTQYIDHRDDIGFHWDRDYGLEEDEERHVHPHLGTVTYLTESTGAPTVIFDKKGTFEFGSDASGPLNGCVLSYPSIGKHICFDGELLHGAPSTLAYPEINEEIEGFRVTFLVNVWLDHVPTQSQRLDRSIAQSLVVPLSLIEKKPLSFASSQTVRPLTTKVKHDGNHKWAIGGTDYIIDINLPPPSALCGVEDCTVVDLVHLKGSSIYPGVLSSDSSGSDESESGSDSGSGDDADSVSIVDSDSATRKRQRSKEGHSVNKKPRA